MCPLWIKQQWWRKKKGVPTAAAATAVEDGEAAAVAALGKEVERHVQIAYQKFAPTSMSDEYLLELATKSTGLLHYETMKDVPAPLHFEYVHRAFHLLQSRTLQLRKSINFIWNHAFDVWHMTTIQGSFFVALLKKVGPIGGQDHRLVRKQQAKKLAQESEADVVQQTKGKGESTTVMDNNNDAEAASEDDDTGPSQKRAKLDG
jgi:hypothetical protein